MYISYIDSTGYNCPELPQECIDDCSAQGSVDDAVDYWLGKLNFDSDIEGTKEYLQGCGAWDTEELDDHDKNLARLLWIICSDIKEEQSA